MRGWWYAVAAVTGAVLVSFPQIDLGVSGLFYTPEEGFYLRNNPELFALYKSVNVLAVLLGAAILGLLLSLRLRQPLAVWTAPRLLYVLLVFGIGSGLIVNAFLKENVGRARPSQIHQFGGEKSFSKPFEPTDQCPSNGSCTCGHCSFAFGFLAFYFLFRKRWILFGAVAYGLLVSATRIMQGGHFLSDAFFSLLVMAATADLLHRYWLSKRLPVPARSLAPVHFAFRQMRMPRRRGRFPDRPLRKPAVSRPALLPPRRADVA